MRSFTLRLRGEARAVLSLLEELGASECQVVVVVNSGEELVKVVSLATEKGVIAEVLPRVADVGYAQPPREHIKGEPTKPKLAEAEEDILSKYKKKQSHATQQTQPQTQTVEAGATNHEAREEKEAATKKEEASAQKEEVKVAVAKDVDILKEMQAKTKDVSFEELVKLKEEAFSRKIIE